MTAEPTPATVAEVLELDEQADGAFLARSPAWGQRVFGGQLLAQALVAAGRTVGRADRSRARGGPAVDVGDVGAGAPEPVPHSLHAYFLRAGDPSAPIRYGVEAIRDGRTFAVREVRATQDDRELFRLAASFQVPERGLDWAPPVALGSPPTDASPMPTYRDWLASTVPPEDTEKHYETATRPRPVEVRYVDPPVNEPQVATTETQRMWLRVPDPLGEDPLVHAAALAYLSDETLLDNAMLPHGLRWTDARLVGASLDHAMWFCRPARADGWLCFDQTVVSTAGGRAQVSGRLHRPDGELLAVCLQEGLIRFPLEG